MVKLVWGMWGGTDLTRDTELILAVFGQDSQDHLAQAGTAQQANFTGERELRRQHSACPRLPSEKQWTFTE